MLQQLRGRNLSHVGCTLGLTLGLTVGLVGALLVITLVTKVAETSIVNIATIVWLGTTVALGLVGYWLGGRVSRRLWGKKPEADGEENPRQATH